MTWQTITEAIKAAGEEARQASLDAHGELVPVREAYEFICGVWYDSEDERYELLPTTWVPNGFARAYKGRG